jgi:hypothetical protein
MRKEYIRGPPFLVGLVGKEVGAKRLEEVSAFELEAADLPRVPHVRKLERWHEQCVADSASRRMREL